MQIIADNIQVTNPLIAKALDEMDSVPIQGLARKCEEAGAGMIPNDSENRLNLAVIIELWLFHPKIWQ